MGFSRFNSPRNKLALSDWLRPRRPTGSCSDRLGPAEISTGRPIQPRTPTGPRRPRYWGPLRLAGARRPAGNPQTDLVPESCLEIDWAPHTKWGPVARLGVRGPAGTPQTWGPELRPTGVPRTYWELLRPTGASQTNLAPQIYWEPPKSTGAPNTNVGPADRHGLRGLTLISLPTPPLREETCPRGSFIYRRRRVHSDPPASM